jgi:hypothetical protein
MSSSNELGDLKKICKTLPVTGSGYRFTKFDKALLQVTTFTLTYIHKITSVNSAWLNQIYDNFPSFSKVQDLILTLRKL